MKNFYRTLTLTTLCVAPFFVVGCENQDASKVEGTASAEVKDGGDTKAAADPAKTDSTATTADSIALNSDNTKVEFVGAHKEAGKDDRFGYFEAVEGTASVADGKLTALDLTINTESIAIKPAESNLDDVLAGKLKDHLSNADFFNTSQFPTAKFSLTKVTEEAGNTILTGNLTLLETTKEISIPATVSTDGGLKIESSTEIDRTEFGMDYGLNDVVEKVKLEITVDATK